MSNSEDVVGSPWGGTSQTLNVPVNHPGIYKHADSQAAELGCWLRLNF